MPGTLGERRSSSSPARPVEAGAGHDRRALGGGEQLGRALDPVGGDLRGGCRRGGRDVGVGLHEDDVERVVEEGRPGRRGAGEVERANRRLGDQRPPP